MLQSEHLFTYGHEYGAENTNEESFVISPA